jgi:hypothetical protein
MPVLAVGGQKSFGAVQATVLRTAANDVTEARVPGSGHWIVEENPGATMRIVLDFLARGPAGAGARDASRAPARSRGPPLAAPSPE